MDITFKTGENSVRIEYLEKKIELLEKKISKLTKQLEKLNEAKELTSALNHDSEKFKVNSGLWVFTNHTYDSQHHIPMRFLTGTFSNTFKSIPKVFYTVKTNHIVNNMAALYEIHSESITNFGFNATISFYGAFQTCKLEIEWIAIGY
jgi:hypothetical protein